MHWKRIFNGIRVLIVGHGHLMLPALLVAMARTATLPTSWNMTLVSLVLSLGCYIRRIEADFIYW